MSVMLSDIEIKAGMIGMGTETMIDGRQLHGVRDLTVHFGLDEANSILVEMIAESYAIKTGGEVSFIAVIKHPVSGEAFRGRSADPVEAFGIALQAMRDAS